MEGLSTSWVRPEVGWLLCGSACLRLRRLKSRWAVYSQSSMAVRVWFLLPSFQFLSTIGPRVVRTWRLWRLVRKGELVPFRNLSAYVTVDISLSQKLSIYRFSVEAIGVVSSWVEVVYGSLVFSDDSNWRLAYPITGDWSLDPYW